MTKATNAKQRHHQIQRPGSSDNYSPDSLWFVLVAGLSGTARPIENHHRSLFARYAAFLDKVAKNRCKYSDVQDVVGIIPEVESSIYLWSSKRLFGITKGGRAVLVPQGTREGDRIVLPAFSVVPLVVRQSGEEPCAGTLLGEAFVHDVMGGEFVEAFNRAHGRIEECSYYAVWMIS